MPGIARKPWQDYDMNLWRAIRNCSAYWFARLILELPNRHSHAFACGIHPEERHAIVRLQQRRRYWRFRRSGLTGDEASAKAAGMTVTRWKMLGRLRDARRRALYGGRATPGTEAYNRYILARK